MKYRLLCVAAAVLLAAGVNAQTVAGDFKVTGGASPADWEYSNNILTIKTGTPVIIEMNSTVLDQDRIVVTTGGATADITLKNVTINRTTGADNNDASCPFMITSGSNAKLTLEGDNVLTAGKGRAGLFVHSAATVTITDHYSEDTNDPPTANKGSLTATGGAQAGGAAGAGIGGHRAAAISGKITIKGGKIIANGGDGVSGDARGIGTATANSSANEIIISGGVVSGSLGSASGTATLTMNGNAAVYAGYMGSNVNKDGVTNGILFTSNASTLYGHVTLGYDIEIPSVNPLAILNERSITVSSGTLLTNNGTINVNNGGKLKGSGVLVNEGTIHINNGGELTGSVALTNEGAINVNNGGELTGSVALTNENTINVNNGGKLTGSVTFDNNGTISIKGELTSNGVLVNEGAINVLKNESDTNGALTSSGSLTNKNNGTINIDQGEFISNGSLTNDGSITFTDESTVTVEGTLTGTKIHGANANRVSGNAVTKGYDSIQVAVTTLKAYTGQAIEYGISTSTDANSVTEWNITGLFKGLVANIPYYFFARSAANENFLLGTASAFSMIRTKPQLKADPLLSEDTIYNNILTLDIRFVGEDEDGVVVSWYRDGVLISEDNIHEDDYDHSAPPTYTHLLTAEDVGKKITAVVRTTNYGGTVETTSGTIQPITVYWSTDNRANTKIYDGNTDANFDDGGNAQKPYIVAGGILPQDAGLAGMKEGNIEFPDPDAGEDKAITATGWGIQGEKAHCYTFDPAGAQPVILGTITKKTISWSTDGKVNTKEYNGTTDADFNSGGGGDAVKPTLDGVLPGDQEKVQVADGIAEFEDPNVGTDKATTESGWGIEGDKAGNYKFATDDEQPVITGTITKKTISWNTDGKVRTKEYDGTTAADFNVGGDAKKPTLNGVVGDLGDDNVKVKEGTAVFEDPNVGTDKATTESGWGIEGDKAGNYQFATPGEQPEIKGTITKKTISWNTDGKVNTKEYDGGTAANFNVGGDANKPTLNGVVGDLGDNNVKVKEGAVVFEDPNAGTDKATTESGWGIEGDNAGNYQFATPGEQPVITGTIEPKAITFAGTVTASKIYDGNNNFNDTQITISDADSFQPGDIVPGDEGKVLLSASGASGTFGPAPGTGVLSNVSGFTLIGEKAHNYTLAAQPSPVPAEILPLPDARDDRASVFACGSKTVNVLANDSHVSGGSLTIDRNGKLGSATPSGTDITYDHNAADCATHGGKRDTVKYSICTATGCDTAKLVVDILRLPKIILMDSCSRRPYFMVNYQYSNAQYQWYRSPTGNDGDWTEMDSSLRLKVYVNEEAWYKVEITFDGETVMDKVHFIIHRKARVQANLYWYITSITR